MNGQNPLLHNRRNAHQAPSIRHLTPLHHRLPLGGLLSSLVRWMKFCAAHRMSLDQM